MLIFRTFVPIFRTVINQTLKKRDGREQTRIEVGFVQTLMYHKKQMEVGLIGYVSSRILELNKQSENKKRLPLGLKQICRMVRKGKEDVAVCLNLKLASIENSYYLRQDSSSYYN